MIKMILSLGILLAVNAFAVNQTSYSQPLKVMDETSTSVSITPSFSSSKSNSKVKMNNRSYSFETTEQNNIIKIEKGINSTSSFGIETTVGRKTITEVYNNRKREFKSSGMGDLTFTYKALKAKELSSFVWGGDLSLSLVDHEGATTAKEGNYATGGHSIRPFIAYESKNEALVTGGLISYQMYGDRKTVYKDIRLINNSSATKSGGNILEAIGFAEVQNNNYVVGMLAGVEMQGASSIEDSIEQDNYDPRTYLKANIYSNVNISEDFSFLPTLKYRTLTSKNVDGLKVDKEEELALFVGLGINI